MDKACLALRQPRFDSSALLGVSLPKKSKRETITEEGKLEKSLDVQRSLELVHPWGWASMEELPGVRGHINITVFFLLP